MGPFRISLYYKDKPVHLLCVWESETTQIQLIRVIAGKNSFVLQNNYPLLQATKSRKRAVWKITEGRVKDAQFLSWVLKDLHR